MRRLLPIAGLLLVAGSAAALPGPFVDVTVGAGVAYEHRDLEVDYDDDRHVAGGIACGDYDGDGWLDLFAVRGDIGPNLLFHNRGDGTFEERAAAAGVADVGRGAGPTFADVDGDGRLDLLVLGVDGTLPTLFHNRGDGTFEEVSKKAGMDDVNRYYGLGVIWGDYDNDGWPDLYVANDAGPNYLYHNKHDGTFEEVGMLSGVALGGDGQAQGSMGVDWGDYRHEGRLSMFVTNFHEQPDTLYRNQGNDGFSDVSWPAKIAQPTFLKVGWGTAFFDMDNDGWLDIFIANGHVYPQVDSIPGGLAYREPIQLFRNHRDGTFEDVSATLAAISPESRRGAAFGDINNGGNVDVVMVNVGALPTLLLNQGGNSNHRVLFKLTGTKSNRSAIGARLTVKAGKLVQFSEVRAGGSYISQNDPRLHFGLGTESRMNDVEIKWPSGKVETLHDLPADFIYTIVEGQGITSKTPLPSP